MPKDDHRKTKKEGKRTESCHLGAISEYVRLSNQSGLVENEHWAVNKQRPWMNSTQREGGRFSEKRGVCEQGLRLSVRCGLSSEVDDAPGEQLRCRAFRLHHYCSPSSSTTNTLPTPPPLHTHSSLINMQKLISASVLLHECLPTRFYMHLMPSSRTSRGTC